VKKYNVTVNGVEAVLLLSDEDAKARGLKASDEAKEAKARTPANKQAKAPANKSPGAVKRDEITGQAWGAKSKTAAKADDDDDDDDEE
jgi:hypothetical protein